MKIPIEHFDWLRKGKIYWWIDECSETLDENSQPASDIAAEPTSVTWLLQSWLSGPAAEPPRPPTEQAGDQPAEPAKWPTSSPAAESASQPTELAGDQPAEQTSPPTELASDQPAESVRWPTSSPAAESADNQATKPVSLPAIRPEVKFWNWL